MIIVVWNCNMAFRKKAGAILEQQPDILVVPECEHPDQLQFPPGVPLPADQLWFGSNRNKGIGIFSYGSFQLTLHPQYNTKLKFVIPVWVTGGHYDFMLYAIWANNPADPDGTYVEQVWKALHYYDPYVTGEQTILAGDFNSNTIWDRKSRTGNHSHVVAKLEAKGIYSAYHLFHRQIQGKEAQATWYMYRHADKPYHLDYCFVSADIADKIERVDIGEYEDWKHLSDHVPLIVKFNL